MALFFHITTLRNKSVLKKTLMENYEDILLDKAEIITERLTAMQHKKTNEIKKEILRYCSEEKDYLHAIIYSQTSDENFFRVVDTVSINQNLVVPISNKEVVQEEKEYNYLKEGLLHGVVEPNLYKRGNITWQNVYYPLSFDGKNLIIQYMISNSDIMHAIENYSSSIRVTRIISIVITVVLAIAVILLTLIFTHNYSLLIDNLSHYIDRAAQGELELNLHETDNELNKLALSFNSLMDELKDKKDRGHHEPEKELFNIGVTMLKENKLDDSIAIFRTLTILKPESFGSYFNLGVAYAKKKDYKQSLTMLEKAAAENPAYDITQKYIVKVKKFLTDNDPA